MKHRFIVFVLLFTLVLFTLSISPVSSQVNDNENELSKGVRPLELSDFPIDWFELNYRNYTDTEIFELSILPLIEPEDINNKEIKDSINLMDRVLLKEVSEQEIEATYGNIYIKRYLFENETELDRFRSCVFKCPNMFRNTYYKDNIMYDIDYDDRRDFESLAEIIALDNIEIVKLNFGNY
ncbi:MAG: hypothetical protein ACOCV8_03750, partial [Spirochaetota bacterium]